MKKTIALLAAVLFLTGCSSSATSVDLNPADFSAKISEAGVITLDVRTQPEFDAGHIEGSTNIDFESGSFETQIESLDKNAVYALYCRSGNRSGQAVKIMSDAGFKNLYNLDAGVVDWANAGLPLVTN